MTMICARSWARLPTAWLLRCIIRCIEFVDGIGYMNVDLEQLRLLPSIDELLQTEAGQQLTLSYSRPLALRAVRASIALARASIRDGALCPPYNELLATAK